MKTSLFFLIFATHLWARPDPTPPDEIISSSSLHLVSDNPKVWEQKWKVADANTGCGLFTDKLLIPPGAGFSMVISNEGWPIYMPRNESIHTLEDWVRAVTFKHYNGPGSGSSVRFYTQSYTHEIAGVSMAPGCILTVWDGAEYSGTSRAWHGGLNGQAFPLDDRSVASAKCSCGIDVGGIPLVSPVQ